MNRDPGRWWRIGYAYGVAYVDRRPWLLDYEPAAASVSFDAGRDAGMAARRYEVAVWMDAQH